MAELILFIIISYLVIKFWIFMRNKISPSRDEEKQTYTSDNAYHWPGEADYDFEVVGESFYQNELETLSGKHGNNNVRIEERATLIPEANNERDSNAIAVFIKNKKVAYLSKDDAKRFRKRLSAKKLSGEITTCDAIIVGGGKGSDGNRLYYGVKLDIEPFE